jgi:hypothetical protein
MFDNDEIVHRYTRADAIRDGVLIDVTAVAQEAGIRYPVALIAGAWAECVAVPPGVQCQDEAGRLWDVVWMLRVGIQRQGGRVVLYSLHVRNDNCGGAPPLGPLAHLPAVVDGRGVHLLPRRRRAVEDRQGGVEAERIPAFDLRDRGRGLGGRHPGGRLRPPREEHDHDGGGLGARLAAAGPGSEPRAVFGGALKGEPAGGWEWLRGAPGTRGPGAIGTAAPGRRRDGGGRIR